MSGALAESSPTAPEDTEIEELARSSSVEALQGAISKSSTYFKQVQSNGLQELIETDGDPLRVKIWTMLELNSVQTFIVSVVLFDFAMVIVDTDAGAAKVETPTWVRNCSFGCLGIYVAEFLLSCFAKRAHNFGSTFFWLDAFIIGFGVGDMLLAAIGSTAMFEQLKLLRLMRLCRLMRLMKLMRFVRSVKALKELKIFLMMIESCLRTLVWTVIMTFMVMLFWACIFVEVVQPIVEDLHAQGQFEDCERCPRAYSSVMASCISIFQTILAGDNWGVVTIPVMEAYPATCIIFVGALLSLVFGFMQLVVCVVVDRFAETREHDMAQRASDRADYEKAEKELLLRLFQHIDADQSGQVTLSELERGVQQLPEFAQRLTAMDISRNDLKHLFTMLDEDESGEIDSEEFIESIYRMTNAEAKTAVHFLKHMLTDLRRRQDGLCQLMLNRQQEDETFDRKALEIVKRDFANGSASLETMVGDMQHRRPESPRGFVRSESFRHALVETRQLMENALEKKLDMGLQELAEKVKTLVASGSLSSTRREAVQGLAKQEIAEVGVALATKLPSGTPCAPLGRIEHCHGAELPGWDPPPSSGARSL